MSIFGTAKPFICVVTATLTISNTVGDGTYATVTTSASHGLKKDEYIYITGVGTMTSLNNIIWLIYDCPTTTTFRVAMTTVKVTGADTGSVRYGYKFVNSTFEFDYVQSDQINHRSVITGAKTNTHLGDYGSFKITERLWQKVTVFTANLRFQRLNGFYHTDIWLFPHSNKVIQNSATTTITCYFKGFKPIYYKGFSAYDAVVCEFETNKYHDVTKLLV